MRSATAVSNPSSATTCCTSPNLLRTMGVKSFTSEEQFTAVSYANLCQHKWRNNRGHNPQPGLHRKQIWSVPRRQRYRRHSPGPHRRQSPPRSHGQSPAWDSGRSPVSSQKSLHRRPHFRREIVISSSPRMLNRHRHKRNGRYPSTQLHEHHRGQHLGWNTAVNRLINSGSMHCRLLRPI